MVAEPRKTLIKIFLFSAVYFFMQAENKVSGQVSYNYFYRVSFRDKGSYTTSSFSASELLSERAIARRQKAGIEVPDFRDLPVNRIYIAQVASMGFKLHCTSKWMNTALFKTVNPADTETVGNLPFVASVRLVKRPVVKGTISDKLELLLEQADIPPFDRPLAMLNGYSLHNSGYNGKGVLIAVLDGGFSQANVINSLDHLRARNGIIGTFDFVNGTGSVYGYHNHGTAVMSVLAGAYINQIKGTAPGADYWLLRTEDTGSEFPVEEDFWAAGAEFADSVGADIISSSLGYYEFDAPEMNYKFADMDGNSTFVTRTADAAASKGIIVVASAGNERNKTWVRIIAPSDGDSVLCAGAVDGYNFISSFSSAGPSADRRVKPDNVAQGVSVPVQVTDYQVARSNGTSFSCPVLSGMCACLLQAVPKAVNAEIIEAVQKSGDRFSLPDSLNGYGLPDMVKALQYLEEIHFTIPESVSVISPNPFTGILEVKFRESPGSLQVDVFNGTGKQILRKNYPSYISRSLLISDLQYSRAGLYFIRITTPNSTITHKVIRINR
jgi:subtilisin family serine protease